MTKTANGSSSSATSRAEPFRLDLLAANRLPPVATAVLRGPGRRLLAPLRYLDPGDLPEGPSRPPERSALAAALAQANEAYGHPKAAQLAAKLADPQTLVVVTGQQPGLFGGPLYGLSKLVAAARWAEELEAQGRPAVAVFWVATEDHDFAEVAGAAIPEGTELRRFHLGEDPQPLLPVGMRHLGPQVTTILAELRGLYGGDRGQAWIDTLERWYRPDARFGEAFSRLMVHLLGERCPLLMDALLPALKQAEAPFMNQLVSQRREVSGALAAAHEDLRQAGLPLQVTPQPGLSPLFYLQGAERRRIEWQGEDHFTLRGEDGPPRPVAQLHEALADNPGVISPGVLARPALQDAVLGTALQVLGPGEMSYMVQAAAVYRVLGLEGPRTVLRPQVLLVEPRQRRWLDSLGLDLETLLGDPKEIEQRLAQRAGGEPVTPAAQQIDALLAELESPVLAIEATLEKPFQRSREQIAKTLEQLAARVAAAMARGNEVTVQRLEGLRAAFLPDATPQERLISVAHFPAKYGKGVVRALFEQMDLNPTVLQTIDLD